jgi:peptide/nickel transport system permease protein
VIAVLALAHYLRAVITMGSRGTPLKVKCALALVCTYVFGGLVGPHLVGSDGLALDLARDLAPPGPTSLLGRADNGVDVLTALVWGARASLFVCVGATVVSASVGVVVGSVAALAGGKIDALILRFLDVLLAFPGLLLAIYLAAVLPPSPLTVLVALSITGWVGFARVARTSVRVQLLREHVVAARALGARPLRVLTRHVLPAAMNPVIVQASFGLSTAILAEASLSFLGLGVAPGTPSWGSLLDEGVAYLFIAPHLAIAPGVCIALVVLAFNVLGDALRDALDVRAAS